MILLMNGAVDGGMINGGCGCESNSVSELATNWTDWAVVVSMFV